MRRSQFLFLFLGNGYLKSEYCLKELEIFRENVGGTIESALNHLYVIVIDRKALERLHERQPDNLPRDRRHLWQRLRDLTQKGIRKGYPPLFELLGLPQGHIPHGTFVLG